MKKLAIGTIIAFCCTTSVFAQSPAEELSAVFQNTLHQNFTAEMNADTQFSFVEDTQALHFDISYPQATLQKYGNDFSYSLTENFVVSGLDQHSTSDSFFPFTVTGSEKQEGVFNFVLGKYAVKFSELDLETTGSPRTESVVDGMMEIVELFENKWIELDFDKLMKKYPEFATDLESAKTEIFDITEISYTLGMGIEQLLAEVRIEKKGNIFRIMPPEYSGIDDVYAEITVQNNIITQITIHAVLPSMNNDLQTFNFTMSASFQYNTSSPISFPSFNKNDLEVTNIVGMFLEFAKNSQKEEMKRKAFWNTLASPLPVVSLLSAQDEEFISSLSASEETKNALRILLSSQHKEHVKAFLKNSKNLNKKITKREYSKLLTLFNVDTYDKKYMVESFQNDLLSARDETMYSYEYEQNTYARTRLVEDFIQIFAAEYMYVPYDVELSEDLFVATRADLIELWARYVQAKK